MLKSFLIWLLLGFTFFLTVSGQRPPPEPRREPRGETHQRPRPSRPEPPPGDWLDHLDTNKNASVGMDEFRDAIGRTFIELDVNGNGKLEGPELKRGPRPLQPGIEGVHMLPPFFFHDQADPDKVFSREDFEMVVKLVFAGIDRDGDGSVSRDEARRLPPRPDAPRPPMPPPNAQFIGAELRFGDKLVKGQPFSADIVIEDTRLLFDGSTARKIRNGAIYRDSNGRTRREQPLEMIGGVNLVGAGNKPPILVFISDFVAGTQLFLDQNARVAKKTRIPDRPPQGGEFRDRPGSKISESTVTVDGISCILTRNESEIPVGQIGNEKPLKVVSESCFSPELQVVIRSTHQDPIAGIHLFRLVNIKRAEPPADIFAIPSGYRIENR